MAEDAEDRMRLGEGKRSTVEVVKAISDDATTLIRKEVELARQEISEAVVARLKAAGAFGAAGIIALIALIFLAVAGVAGLELVLARWLAWLIVGGAFLLLAGGAAAFGLRRAKQPPMAPEETKRTMKEDFEWAKQQLKR